MISSLLSNNNKTFQYWIFRIFDAGNGGVGVVIAGIGAINIEDCAIIIAIIANIIADAIKISTIH